MDTKAWVAAAALTALVPILTLAGHSGKRRLALVLETLCSIVFMALGIVSVTGAWTMFHLFMAAGLLFCLIGDVLLAMDDRFFIWGLAAFLTGHLGYIAAFILRRGWEPLAILGTVALWGAFVWIGWRMRARPGKHLLPVFFYIGVISLMFCYAQTQNSVLLSLGTLFFVVSDTVLATGRFVRPVPLGSSLVLGFYYAGQMLIAVSMGVLA